MSKMHKSQYLIRDPVVYLNRVHDVFAVCFKSYVKDLPSGSKFYLPCKLTEIPCDVSNSVMSASWYDLRTDSGTIALVLDLLFTRQVFVGYRSIQSSTVCTDRKVR